MSDSKIEELLADVRSLLVAQLLVARVQVGEIEEILNLGEGNFSKYYKAKKLITRLRSNESDNKRKKKTKK